MFTVFRFFSSSRSWLGGLAALLVATTAYADPPVASTDLSAGEKVGVTVYQVNGLKGSIPLKKVYKVDPSGDTGHYELQFASNNMNTQMQIMAKYVVPAGMTFKSFEIHTANGPTQVTPAGADSWDGQTIIDKVTVSPWNMSRVLQQCIAHLQNGDGTFKDSATFDLQADTTEVIRGNGIATPPNAPPGSASSSSGTMKPRTRVTAYIVAEERKGSESPRDAQRVLPAENRVEARRPVLQPNGLPPSSGRVVTTPPNVRLPQPVVPAVRQPVPATVRLPVATPQPPRTPAARLTGTVNPIPAKDRFERTKPHMSAPIRPMTQSSKPAPRR